MVLSACDKWIQSYMELNCGGGKKKVFFHLVLL